MDVDRWKKVDIHAINKICKEQKKGTWKCAISNPAFEIWLLMHYQEVTKEFLENPPKSLKKYLHSVTGDGYRLETALTGIKKALAQAKKLDKDPNHYFPALYQSKVYQLVEALEQQLRRK